MTELLDVAADAAKNTVSKSPAGDVAKAALEGAATGASAAGTVIGVGSTATTVATATGAEAVTAALAAAGTTLGAVSAAIPIPVLGSLIGAVAAAGVAIGVAFGADDFHPTKEQARDLRALADLDPLVLFSGINNAKDPNRGARLIRYLNLVSGRVPMKPGWQLHNPNDDSGLNPYEASVDPKDPLTDPKTLEPIYWEAEAARRKGVPYTAPSFVQTEAQAKAVLSLLRRRGKDMMAWSQVAGNTARLRDEIKAVRLLAGEDGPDPTLSRLFGGEVTVSQGLFGGWGGVVGVSLFALALGGALVAREYQKLGVRLNELKLADPPGKAAYKRVLARGVVDGELQFLRSGMRSMLPFSRAFRKARHHGISATDLATTGRYFNEEVLPIRIEVHADGSVHLADGRHRYTAAKEAGARGILATVVLLDAEGTQAEEQLAVVRLV